MLKMNSFVLRLYPLSFNAGAKIKIFFNQCASLPKRAKFLITDFTFAYI